MNDADLKKTKTVCLVMVWIIVIFIPLYWWREPARQEAAIARIKREALTRGAEIYVSHCVTCHGNTGNDIPGKNLHRTPIEEAALAKIIARGRPDAGMPSLGNEEGGSLKNFEINDVIAFIKSWDQSILETAMAQMARATAITPELP